MRYIYLLSFLLLSSCEDSKVLSAIEAEISEIEVNKSVDELKSKDFENFHIEWTNYFLYEPDCGQYDVIPKVDTFNNSYSLTFCLGRYMYFDSYFKKDSEVSNVSFFNKKENLYLNLEGHNRFDNIIRNEGSFHSFSDTTTIFHPTHYFEVVYMRRLNESKRVFWVDYGEIEKDNLLELVKSGLIKNDNDEAELLNKISVQILKNDTNSIAFSTDYSLAMVNDELMLRELIKNELVDFFNRVDAGDEVIISDLSFILNEKTEHLDEFIKFKIAKSY